MSEYTLQTIGDIGDSGWYWGVDLKALEDQLRGVQAETINVPISSYGGDYFDGIAIYHYLRARKEKITTSILGFAMSMGSVIALAGDKVIMPKGGYFMIHNARLRAGGDENDLQKYADYTRSFSVTLASIYFEYNQKRGRTKLSIDEIKSMMDAETFLTAELAEEYGFVTEISNNMPVWTGRYNDDLPENAPEDLLKLKNSQNMKDFDLMAIAKSITGKLFKSEDEAKAGLVEFTNTNKDITGRIEKLEGAFSQQIEDANTALTAAKGEIEALRTEIEGFKGLTARIDDLAGKVAAANADDKGKPRGGNTPDLKGWEAKRAEFANTVRKVVVKEED